MSLAFSSCFICLHRGFLFSSLLLSCQLSCRALPGWLVGWLVLVYRPLGSLSVPAQSRAAPSAPGGHPGLRFLPSLVRAPKKTGVESELQTSVLHSHQRQNSRFQIVLLQNFEDFRTFHAAGEKSDSRSLVGSLYSMFHS